MAQEQVSISLTYCTDCGHYFSLAPYACRRCGSTALKLRPASGEGVVRAVTHVHRGPDAAWQAKVPYALALVRLSEGPTIMTHVGLDTQVGDDVFLKNTTIISEGEH